MRSRSQGAVAFATILAICTAGILQLTWWAALAGGCVLALISIHNHPVTFRALGGATSPGTLIFVSLSNAAVTSSAALIMGRAIGWIWGV